MPSRGVRKDFSRPAILKSVEAPRDEVELHFAINVKKASDSMLKRTSSSYDERWEFRELSRSLSGSRLRVDRAAITLFLSFPVTRFLRSLQTSPVHRNTVTHITVKV